ncbi:hypothetical protein F0919_15875 [Taibaiella lutea]|uniref:Porin n=1 Tax=Taibaiella lutea TaxID=2608001 RepID=A0A5M6CAW5_9BACT|nr:putative porin [Taibaiella lutea]KAA5532274.1 hypothetical protein F0919_15875 [Taibaiella lutea]
MILIIITSLTGRAQVMNNNFGTNPQNGFDPNNPTNLSDSAKNKLNKEWKEESAVIYYNTLNSAKAKYLDSSLSNFHHYQPIQPWWGKDLGNYGTAIRNQFFTPVTPIGLSLGYHAYYMYMMTLDSLRFYNTTRPYSSFQYLLGSKLEQNASILHTQNINPFWNFAFNMRYNSAAGFYKLQKANNLSFSFNTNYLSPNKRYYVASGIIYNKFRQDENGGVQDVSQLGDPLYSKRTTMEVNLPQGSSQTSAAVTNAESVFDFYIQNNYSFGKTDTLYNQDSTGMSLEFTPRFRIKHQLLLHSDKHTFRDSDPDSARYADAKIANHKFLPTDTVFNTQSQFYIDNKFSLNGFIGKLKELVEIEAGVGNRIDFFNTNYATGKDKLNSVGNYLFGEIKKEAFKTGQWEYQANAQFFLTGDAVGNFNINGSIGKDLGKWGNFSAGFKQNLSNAPYTFTTFNTDFYKNNYSLGKVSVTQLWAKTIIPKIKLELGLNNSLISNYIYYDETNTVQQESTAFSVLQVYGRKDIKLRAFHFNNEVVWQKATSAPVNLPDILIRSQLGITTPLFKSALIVSSGLEARYHTPYYSDGYTPYYNQFVYQTTTKITNVPEVMAYFNFKVKTFRAFVMFDQLQQLFTENAINAAPNYPAPNTMFRFGFNWIMIN